MLLVSSELKDKAVTVDELLHGVIVQSGNDATIALAEDACHASSLSY